MDPNNDPPQPAEGSARQTLDQIRARRVNKLSGDSSSQSAENRTQESQQTPSSSAPSRPQSTGASETKKKPETNKATPPATTPSGQSSSNPFSQLAVDPGRSSEAAGSSGTPRLNRKRTVSQVDDGLLATSPQCKPTPAPPESDEDYIDRVLSQTFRVSVDPHRMKTAQGNHRLIFLPNLNQELNENKDPLKLTIANLDQAIIEACTALPHSKQLMDYLLPCWKRTLKAAASAKSAGGARAKAVEEAKRLCMSNCLFALTMPVLYGREDPPEYGALAPYILRGVNDTEGIDFEFYQEAIKRFDEDEAFPALFTDAMVTIAKKLASQSMHYLYIEKETILGPFFRLSPLQPDVMKSYFPTARYLDRGRIQSGQDSLRMVLQAHQDELFSIANAFIRAGPESRKRTLSWFASIVNTNHKRRAIQVNPAEVSSDGFMVNITAILDRFCEPFMDNSFSKIDKIHVRHIRPHPLVNIQDETKLNADQAASDAFLSKDEEGEPNFITDIFFLTLAGHHYGTQAVQSSLKSLDREIKYLQKHITAMEAERPKVAHSPHQLKLFEETLRRHQNVLEKSCAMKHTIEGILMDERMQSLSLKFMRYVTVWLLRVATESDYKPGLESETIKLPMTMSPENFFPYLPEYVLQNIVDNFKFVFRLLPKLLPNAIGEELIALSITFLRCSEFIKNPYLKSSLVSLLFLGTWPLMHLKRGVLGDLLTSIKFAHDYLLHALIKFYIECESTGAHTAFYDKFNIRYEIFQVIKCIWINDVYRQQLIKESKSNRAFFIQFVNMLLNDTTYVLDEAFTKFPKMRQLERELDDPSLIGEDRQKKEEELQTLGSQATSYMQLANETLEMMRLFTETLSEAFTMPEIVSRLASMLNYNLETLAGKKAAAELSVSNKDKYHFRPIQLISDFVDIYLNLGSSQVFIDAVAADGRSYSVELLDRVTRILTSKHQKDPQDIARFDKLKTKFAAAKELQDKAELDLGEIPADFEDPIMGDLMRDPVLLPSKHIVDRSTIVQHLLSDAKDPFTRQPMTIDDVVPQPELQDRIEKWRLEKIEQSRRQLQGDEMDTTEGARHEGIWRF
ncbi:Ubiquitin conjugation factor E4 [Escovopsis weberi]|uniref:Ubiquitin conjugation factor E4 n=1 Tax=Escovopsis weberi TaxID=150374 RepID=A0A0M8N820_ESCWE|nr:Ubiquitin conjugation factor E4 [Escovopsis weberi]